MSHWLAWTLLACGASDDGSERSVPGTTIVLLAMDGGTFDMGSPEDEVGRAPQRAQEGGVWEA